MALVLRLDNYEKVDKGYKVVPAPVGAKVSELPENSVQVVVGSKTYYYYGGAFYQPSSKKYKVVAAPAGAVVSSLPDGANTVVFTLSGGNVDPEFFATVIAG